MNPGNGFSNEAFQAFENADQLYGEICSPQQIPPRMTARPSEARLGASCKLSYTTQVKIHKNVSESRQIRSFLCFFENSWICLEFVWLLAFWGWRDMLGGWIATATPPQNAKSWLYPSFLTFGFFRSKKSKQKSEKLKKALFFCETPQTDSEPVRGLENLTPRGHCINKNKNQILFWKFWVFRFFFRPKPKNIFSKTIKSYIIYKEKVPKKLQKHGFSGFGGFSGSRLPRPRATQWEFRDATCWGYR